jgi:hypothetical protein
MVVQGVPLSEIHQAIGPELCDKPLLVVQLQDSHRWTSIVTRQAQAYDTIPTCDSGEFPSSRVTISSVWLASVQPDGFGSMDIGLSASETPRQLLYSTSSN